MGQSKKWYLILIAVGILALLLGACMGAGIGGFVGYRLGRNAQSEAPQSDNVPQTPWQMPQQRQPGRQQTPQPDQSVPATDGAWITAVTAGSPASQAGIQPGDVIAAVDGVQVNEQNTLVAIVSHHKPGDTIELTLVSQGGQKMVQVQLAARSDNPEVAFLGVTYVLSSAMPTPEMDTH